MWRVGNVENGTTDNKPWNLGEEGWPRIPLTKKDKEGQEGKIRPGGHQGQQETP